MNESAPKSQRLDELLTKLSSLSVSGDLQAAADVLREAAALDPEDVRVKEAWSALQTAESKSHLLDSLRAYFTSHDESLGAAAAKAAGSDVLTAKDAEEALTLIFQEKNDNSQVIEDVLARLLASPSGKRAMVPFINEKAEIVLNRVKSLPSGIVLHEMVNILLDLPLWDGKSSQLDSERDLFRLMINDLHSDKPLLESLMRAIAKLLAHDAKHLQPITTAADFNLILTFLDLRRPYALRSQATLALAKLLEADPDQEKAQTALKDFVISRVGNASPNDLILAFSAAAAMFPILPAMASNLFLIESFVSDVVKLVEKSQDQILRQAVLELFSAACIDKACRQSINRNCSPWLKSVIQSKENAANAAMAALILSKTSEEVGKSKGDNGLGELVPLFKQSITKSDQQTLQSSVEGLAFLSIQPPIKDTLIKDKEFLKLLIKIVNAHFANKAIIFGGLTVFQNLTAYLPVLSAEEKRMDELKAYANQTKPSAPDPLDRDEAVNARCRIIIESGFVPLLVKCQQQSPASPTFMKLTTDITISLTQEPKLRGKLAQLGLFDMTLKMANIAPGDDQTLLWVRRQSALALARFLIPIDPALLFGTNARRDVLLAIRPLSLLLDAPDADDPVLSKRQAIDHRPTFEALRALSNLAVLNTISVQLLVEHCFDKVMELLWSRISAICQAATECILNMTTDWAAVSKFVSAEAICQNRLRLLYALTGAEAIGTRTAATAALSHVMASIEGIEAFLKLKGGVEGLVEILQDEHAGMRIRAATCVYSLVADNGASGKEARRRVSAADGKALLQKVDAPSEYRPMIVDAVKCLETGEGLPPED